MAALFHEIGVGKLSRGLMFKKDPLTPEAVQFLRSRPLLSAEMLQSLAVDGHLGVQRRGDDIQPLGCALGIMSGLWLVVISLAVTIAAPPSTERSGGTCTES